MSKTFVNYSGNVTPLSINVSIELPSKEDFESKLYELLQEKYFGVQISEETLNNFQFDLYKFIEESTVIHSEAKVDY